MSDVVAARRFEAASIGMLVAFAVAATYRTALILATNPSVFGLDLNAYLAAAQRLEATGSPYAAELYFGPIEHVIANIPIAYFYPPPLAQLFVPLTHLPFDVVAMAWALTQASLLLALLPLVYRANGGTLTPRVVLVIALAAVSFAPFQWAITIGNVSGWVAVFVAAMLLGRSHSRAGIAALASVLKVTPGALAVGAFIAGSSRRQSIVYLAAISGASVAIAPSAWAGFVEVLPSLIRLPAASGVQNVAPINVLDDLIARPIAIAFGFAIAAVFLAGTIWAASKERTLAWIAMAVGVYLSVTSTTWVHYLAALLPIAAAAWPRGTPTMRLLIVAVLVLYGPLWDLAESSLRIIGMVLWIWALFCTGLARPRPIESPGRTSVPMSPEDKVLLGKAH